MSVGIYFRETRSPILKHFDIFPRISFFNIFSLFYLPVFF